MFKNILVASDGSKCGAKAVDLAIDMAAKYGAKISALYVMDFDSDLSYDELDDMGGAVLDDITLKGKEKGVVVVEHIITANPVFDMETMIRKINPEIAVFFLITFIVSCLLVIFTNYYPFLFLIFLPYIWIFGPRLDYYERKPVFY